MPKILVVYYSMYGHVAAMAKAVAAGAEEVEGAAVAVRGVPELMSEEQASQAGAVLEPDVAVAAPNDLADYDAVLFGTPTRFGTMCAQMRNFLDQTGGLWAKGALVGKIGSVFGSTGTQHGGQETTLTSFHTTLLHHGMVVVGVPYACAELTNMKEIVGGTPYGATTLAGADGSRQPSEIELSIARFQGRHVAGLAAKLV